MTWVAVVMGGALGTAARHAVNLAMARAISTPVPWATATVNMIGSLVIGVLAGALAAERLSMSPFARTFVFVGILGGFTTFSSFMLDSLTVIHAGAPIKAALNLVGQLALGLALTIGGYYLALRA
ncbi:MAG TPA: CrcB family protein [Vicinamibacterales bacterium]|jgi:CrcB protein